MPAYVRRRRTVLKLMVAGVGIEGIAAKLKLSTKTIYNTLPSMRSKYKFHSMVGMAILLMAGLAPVRLLGATHPLLRDAFRNYAKDYGHWAYVETRTGRRGLTVIRVDPSKPYGEQRVPILIDGGPPTGAELKKYRDDLEESAQKAGNRGLRPVGPPLARWTILERASVFREDAETVTYLVPLRRDRTGRIPTDKFKVLVRVNRKRRALEHISFVLQEPFRKDVIAKADAIDAEIDFTAPDPRFGPLATRMRISFSGSVLLFRIQDIASMTLTEIRHVTPYDDRFHVQVGPLKEIGVF